MRKLINPFTRIILSYVQVHPAIPAIIETLGNINVNIVSLKTPRINHSFYG